MVNPIGMQLGKSYAEIRVKFSVLSQAVIC